MIEKINFLLDFFYLKEDRMFMIDCKKTLFYETFIHEKKGYNNKYKITNIKNSKEFHFTLNKSGLKAWKNDRKN